MFTKEQILHQLKIFLEAVGKPVTVHTSMKAVGEVEGGAEGLLDTLIRFFTGNGGLLIIPTHTWDSELYDRRKNETCLGVLPRVAAGHPLGVRSLHPTHSVTVFGENAAAFACADDNTDSPVHPDGCYGSIIKEKGYVLLLGVGHDKNTCIHCVEEMLSVKNRLTSEKVQRTIIHRDGRKETRRLYWFDEETIPDVSVYFPKLEPVFRYYDCILDGFLGNAPAQLCKTAEMKIAMENLYNRAGGKELLDNDFPIPDALYKIKKL